MKKFGLAAATLMVVVAVACGGGRDEENTGAANDTTRTGTVGTGGDTTTTTPDTRTSGDDLQRWIQDITMHNTAEIELGKLASERASNAQVKQFGQMMVRDHTMAGNELKKVVEGHIPVQEQMDEKHRDLAQKLRGMQGAEFDREYMTAMADGHQEVKNMLEERARDATNTGTTANRTDPNAGHDQLAMGVNQWAAKTLPTVEKHLQQAEQLKAKVEGGARTTQNTGTRNRNTTGTTGDRPGNRTDTPGDRPGNPHTP
jgi:putative membrane protein